MTQRHVCVVKLANKHDVASSRLLVEDWTLFFICSRGFVRGANRLVQQAEMVEKIFRFIPHTHHFSLLMVTFGELIILLLGGVLYFSNERRFSVESSLQRISSIFLDSSVVL